MNSGGGGAPITTSYHRKAETAAFKSQRKDMLFSGNDLPGPGQYNQGVRNGDSGFGSGLVNGRASTSGNWHTNIGAFGSTEKRFASLFRHHTNNLNNSLIFESNNNLSTNNTTSMAHHSLQGTQSVPGPGEYEQKSQFGTAIKYITRKIRGKNIRMRSEMPNSAVFKSSTCRTME